MTRLALLLLVLRAAAAGQPASAPERDWPTLSKERIVLRTSLGDLVLALFPEVAPGHAAQILRLARLGVYDTTHFHKVNRDFAIQISGMGGRRLPLTPEQQAALHPLKAELNRYRHRYGVVTMAHDPGAPDTAQASFLIMLGDIPEMDGKFTVVGDVEMGHDVLEAIRNVAVDGAGRPVQRIEVERALVVDADEIGKVGLRPARGDLASLVPESLPAGFGPLAIALVVLGAAFLAVAAAFRGRTLRAIGMIALLVGFFQLFVLWAPAAQGAPGVAIALFAASLAVFKLMSQFERYREK